MKASLSGPTPGDTTARGGRAASPSPTTRTPTKEWGLVTTRGTPVTRRRGTPGPTTTTTPTSTWAGRRRRSGGESIAGAMQPSGDPRRDVESYDIAANSAKMTKSPVGKLSVCLSCTYVLCAYIASHHLLTQLRAEAQEALSEVPAQEEEVPHVLRGEEGVRPADGRSQQLRVPLHLPDRDVP